MNPLDGVVRIAEGKEVAGTFKYFLKVRQPTRWHGRSSAHPHLQLVPTQFKRLGGRVVHTHQYSTTEYFTAQKEGDMLTPIISFAYDFSPVSVVVEQRRRPLLHFLTRTCAVLGGVYAMTESVNRIASAALGAKGGPSLSLG